MPGGLDKSLCSDGLVPHHVVAGALVGPRGALLAHRRRDRTYYPDCWDLPGGHIEPGEQAADALSRELLEEVGVTATITGASRLRVVEDPDAPDGLVLHLWVVTAWHGEPMNVATDEHDELRWVTLPEIDSLRLAHPAVKDLLNDVLG